MKRVIAAILLVASSVAFGATQSGLSSSDLNSAGFSKLSEAEKAAIIKQVADTAATKNIFGQNSESTDERVERWVNIGTKLGQALGGAAKEVGVAVNDFAKSPVGQLTTVLIVWHMIGAQLIHVFGGIMIWVIGFAMINYVFNRSYPTKVTYSTERKNIFGNPVVEKVERQSAINDAGSWMFACGIVLVAGLVAIFTF